jgi:hypothetical protein
MLRDKNSNTLAREKQDLTNFYTFTQEENSEIMNVFLTLIHMEYREYT